MMNLLMTATILTTNPTLESGVIEPSTLTQGATARTYKDCQIYRPSPFQPKDDSGPVPPKKRCLDRFAADDAFLVAQASNQPHQIKGLLDVFKTPTERIRDRQDKTPTSQSNKRS
jgi:hypothetical protein